MDDPFIYFRCGKDNIPILLITSEIMAIFGFQVPSSALPTRFVENSLGNSVSYFLNNWLKMILRSFELQIYTPFGVLKSYLTNGQTQKLISEGICWQCWENL